MQQSATDNQSNLFSFNGFGTRQNWADGMRSGMGGESKFDAGS